MKILIVSDTHNRVDFEAIKEITKLGPFDMLIHAGDLYEDAACISDDLNIACFISVCGNCDRRVEPIDEEIEIYGKKIYITHGHTYYVKQGLELLKQEALKNKYDIVIYGHTHIPHYEKIDDTRFINPGSLSIPLITNPTYGILELSKNEISYSSYEL